MKEALANLRSMKAFRKQEILPMLVVESLGACLAPKINLLGKDNLTVIRNLNREPETHFFFLANHPNVADTSVFFKSIKRSGLDPLARRILPIKGKQLEDNEVTNWLSKCLDTIIAWPPCIEPMGQEQIGIRNQMARDTLRATKEARRNRIHILVYPETRVSPDGTLQNGYPEVAQLIHQTAKDNYNLNTFIVLVGISGTQKMISTSFPYLRPGIPTVNFGEPENFAIIKDTFKDDYKSMTNYFMRGIANLLPQQNRGLYAKV